MTDVELAWLSGLFEGEGTMSYGNHQVIVRMQMCDEDVIRRAHALAGGQVYGPYPPTGMGKRDVWLWQVTKSAQSLDLLRQMLPFFGKRRAAQVAAVVGRWDTRPIKRQYTTPRGNQIPAAPVGAAG